MGKGTLSNPTRCAYSSVLHRWAKSARHGAASCTHDECSTKELAFIVQLITDGRVEQALSVAMTGHKMHLPASLESLVGFAANPIPLGAIKARMRLNELLEKVRCIMRERLSRIPCTRLSRASRKIITSLHVHPPRLSAPSAPFQPPGAHIRSPAHPCYHQRDTCLTCTVADRS